MHAVTLTGGVAHTGQTARMSTGTAGFEWRPLEPVGELRPKTKFEAEEESSEEKEGRGRTYTLHCRLRPNRDRKRQ